MSINKTEGDIIQQIAVRAAALAQEAGVDYDRMDAFLDVCACHLNGTPLKLQELLDAPKGTFGHDVFGIRRFINRDTGKLGGCFLPRLAVQ